MFTKLKKKWNVDGLRFFLIFLTFGITGTFTAWVSLVITGWLGIAKFSTGWWILKIGVLLIGYQVFLLFFGFCFGQFSFFWKIEKNILRKLGLLPGNRTRLAIFASGNGSNALKIIQYFSEHKSIKVSLVVSNKENAGVLNIARKHGIDTLIINRDKFYSGAFISQLRDTDYIILAGFLWKIPEMLISKYAGKIINIHPALLPKYGGKGMYGHHVHEQVVQNGDKETGITIHYVDEHYDSGDIIFQASCKVEASDSPADVAKKVQQLEHQHFPRVIDEVIKAKSPLKRSII